MYCDKCGPQSAAGFSRNLILCKDKCYVIYQCKNTSKLMLYSVILYSLIQCNIKYFKLDCLTGLWLFLIWTWTIMPLLLYHLPHDITWYAIYMKTGLGSSHMFTTTILQAVYRYLLRMSKTIVLNISPYIVAWPTSQNVCTKRFKRKNFERVLCKGYTNITHEKPCSETRRKSLLIESLWKRGSV